MRRANGESKGVTSADAWEAAAGDWRAVADGSGACFAAGLWQPRARGGVAAARCETS